MSRFSAKNYFERMESIALRDTRPMSAGYCWTLVDNLAHLIDESYKYRLNFVQAAGQTYFYRNNLGEQYGFEFYFQTHMPQPDRYPRFDLRVAMYQRDGANDVRASIVTPSVTWPVTGDTPGVLGTISALIGPGDPITYIGTTTYLIDTSFPAVSTEQAPAVIWPAPSYPSGDALAGRMAMLKLIVEWPMLVDEAGPNAAIRGVTVREYPE